MCTSSTTLKPLIVILGPTAVGKTKLSLELAQLLKTQIISGDSMLVYKHFDIGSAKPTQAELMQVKHYLIDILEGDAVFNATEFCQLAAQKIDLIAAAGKIPIIAGGTGLYLKSLLEGYQFNTAPADLAYRAQLEALAQEHGRAYVKNMLAAVDPVTAERLHINDFNRIIRALEVQRYNAEHISTKRYFAEAGKLCYNALVIGLRRERQHLYERIDQRVDLMMQAGFIEEVAALLRAGHSREEHAMQAIGYKQINAYLAQECSLETAVAEIKKATRHFAKRQFTWYRKMSYIDWIDVDDLNDEALLQQAYILVERKFLQPKQK